MIIQSSLLSDYKYFKEQVKVPDDHLLIKSYEMNVPQVITIIIMIMNCKSLIEISNVNCIRYSLLTVCS